MRFDIALRRTTLLLSACTLFACGQSSEQNNPPPSGGSVTTGGGTAGESGSGAGGASSSGGAAGADVSSGPGGSGGSTGGEGGAAGGGPTGGAAGSGGAAGAGVGGAGGTAGAGAGALHFAAYGDTRTGFATHQQVIDRIARLDPQLIIHSGDLWDGYTQDTFRSILTKNVNVGKLLGSGLFVVSRGNHETVADYLAFTPSLARDNKSERFSYTVGNSFFVIMGMDPAPAAAFLESELKKPEAAAARWRFVQSHYPIYSGGLHGARGIPAIEKLCDQYHVAVYWSGHDHIYERSHQIFGSQVVDTGDALSVNKGTVYVVSGGGGAPLYTSNKIPTTHTNLSTNNYVDAVADQNLLTVKAYKLDGSLLDSFSIRQ
jgi:Calcineurin-like phosphoesterase